jgi:Flp pilus assembly protein TadD
MLKQFIETRPDDPFPRYALAMEYKGAGNLEGAAEAFRELTTRAAGYVATYLQFGMVLEQLGRTDEARQAFTQGIEQARKAGNGHALSELESALNGLD